jgi:hypothetical protein
MGNNYDKNEEFNERKYVKKLSVSQSTFDLVTKDCIKAFLEDNPDFEGMKITQNYIIRRMAKRYLKL